MSEASVAFHNHIFLSASHQSSERKTWAVIVLCTAMMFAEIVGGWMFGSIALIADGMHMSTHAGALLLAALAYTFARRYAQDSRFTFGTGKFGDLAGFASALVLAMIALLIGVEAVARLFAPVSIRFGEAIPIAALGLAVNVASAWLLSGGDHNHGHGYGASRDHANDNHDEARRFETPRGGLALEIFEIGVAPRFRLRSEGGRLPDPKDLSVETVRPDGARQAFAFRDAGGFLESVDDIPEPHEFTTNVRVDHDVFPVVFVEHEHADAAALRDNNLRAAFLHVMGDAAVSVMVIVGLVLARIFGWLWMDPLAGIVGALVIANWSFALIRDTSAILLDMNPDNRMAENLRRAIEDGGDRVSDLHLWRLGPGHLGAILSVVTVSARSEADYRQRLKRFRSLSHLTIEVQRASSL